MGRGRQSQSDLRGGEGPGPGGCCPDSAPPASRSLARDDLVQKEEKACDESQFMLGKQDMQRQVKTRFRILLACSNMIDNQ